MSRMDGSRSAGFEHIYTEKWVQVGNEALINGFEQVEAAIRRVSRACYVNGHET